MLGGPGWYSRKAPMTYLALAAFLLSFVSPMGVPSTGAVPVQQGPCGSNSSFYPSSSSTGTDSCPYGSEGVVDIFVVPAGVSNVAVVAIGGAGGQAQNGVWLPTTGGFGAVVDNAALPVVAGTTLYVYVGQDGDAGGWGESSAPSGPGNYGQGGSGGGFGGAAGGTGYAGNSCDPSSSCPEVGGGGGSSGTPGAGGGGGGSSYGGPGGPVTVTTEAPNQQPSVVISWAPSTSAATSATTTPAPPSGGPTTTTMAPSPAP